MTAEHSLAARRILITGGSSGIGLATAQRLTAAGARAVLLARGEPALEEATAATAGVEGYVPADVADAGQTREAVARASEMLGGLDVVIADAALAAYGPFAALSPEDYRETVQATLLGVMNVAHAALPVLEPSRGTLVIVGSVAARVPVPWLSAYAAAKHGVRGFARSLACELRALRIPVRIALVNPGPVDTRFWRRVRTPDGRLPPEVPGPYRPDDVAAEIELALAGRGGLERTVGGLVAGWAFLDALAPNLAVRVMGPLATLGWRRRRRKPLSPGDSLSRPLGRAKLSGGLRSRPSLLAKVRQAAS